MIKTPGLPVFAALLATGAVALSGCRMGVATSNASDGVLPTSDTTPPQVVSVQPTDAATNVALNAVISVTMSEPLKPATVGDTTLLLEDGSVSIPVLVQYTPGSLSASLDPVSDLDAATTYTATVTTGVQDEAGNALAASYQWTFTTGAAADTTPPTVASTVPSSNAVGVAVDTVVSATFSEAMNPASLNSTTWVVRVGGTPVSGSRSYSGNTASFQPDAPLSGATVYTATITTGATDAAGNPLAADYVWSFTITTYTATLTWLEPTTNADSTPLTDLAGYKIHFGMTPSSGPGFVYDTTTDIGQSASCAPNNGGEMECTYSMSGAPLSSGTFYFAVTAHDWSGNDSAYSNEASKTFP